MVTLGNNGNLPLTISTLTVTSASLGTGTTCDTNTAVAAGAAYSLAIDFIPVAQGSQTGSVSITDNSLYVSPNLIQTIQLSGLGLGSGSTADYFFPGTGFASGIWRGADCAGSNCQFRACGVLCDHWSRDSFGLDADHHWKRAQ